MDASGYVSDRSLSLSPRHGQRQHAEDHQPKHHPLHLDACDGAGRAVEDIRSGSERGQRMSLSLMEL